MIKKSIFYSFINYFIMFILNLLENKNNMSTNQQIKHKRWD